MADLLEAFDREARTRVNEAVSRAESLTSVDLVPVLVPRSSTYERAEDIVGLWCGLLLMGLAWVTLQGVGTDGTWAGLPEVRLGFWTLAGLLLAGFLGGVLLADRYPRLRRLFIPSRGMDAAVRSRAEAIFYDRKLHRTSRGTSLLLLVSLLERRAVVFADDLVAAKVGERALGEIRDELLGGVREKGLEEGFARGLERAGSLLATAFPPVEGRANEIPDEVIVYDS